MYKILLYFLFLCDVLFGEDYPVKTTDRNLYEPYDD